MQLKNAQENRNKTCDKIAQGKTITIQETIDGSWLQEKKLQWLKLHHTHAGLENNRACKSTVVSLFEKGIFFSFSPSAKNYSRQKTKQKPSQASNQTEYKHLQIQRSTFLNYK